MLPISLLNNKIILIQQNNNMKPINEEDKFCNFEFLASGEHHNLTRSFKNESNEDFCQATHS